MNRLTFEGNFCDIVKCSEVRGGSFCEDGYCTQRIIWERLKEYEDLGDFYRLKELAEADKDGRCVVLPCNVGDTVYFINRDYDSEICEGVVTHFEIMMCPFWARIKYHSKRLGRMEYRNRWDRMYGKTVFLTRAEAEAALEGIGNDRGK